MFNRNLLERLFANYASAAGGAWIDA